MSTVEVGRIRRLHIGFQVFFSLLLWLPVFYEFQKRNGLGDAEIFSIQSAYYLAFCFFEIPTGWLADRFGYVRCMRAGAWLTVATNLVPCFAPGYAGMLIHFLGIALSRSLISGAGSAWLYESLAERNAAAAYKEIEGQARALGLAAKVLLWLLVGSMMEWRLDLPYWATAVLTAIAIPVAARMHEPGNRAPTAVEGAGSRVGAWAGAWAQLRSHPRLGLLMVQGVALFVLSRIIQVNLFQPILGAKQFPLEGYGAVLSGMTIFEAIGSARSRWIRSRFDDETSVFVLTAVMAVSLAGVPFAGPWGAVALLCATSAAVGFAFPIQKQLINDAIPSGGYRATLLSFESILDRGACSVVAWGMAFALDRVGLDGFLIQSCAAVMVLLIAVAWALRSKPIIITQES